MLSFHTYFLFVSSTRHVLSLSSDDLLYLDISLIYLLLGKKNLNLALGTLSLYVDRTRVNVAAHETKRVALSSGGESPRFLQKRELFFHMLY